MAKRVLTFSAKTILNRSFRELPFDGEWEALMGKPEPNFRAIIHGAPKQGKTTFTMQAALELSKYGKVLVSVSETGISKSLQSLLERTGISPDNDRIRFVYCQTVAELEAKVKSRAGYRFIIVDSAQSCGLTVGRFIKLYKAYPHKSFLVVLQSNRNGNFNGPQRWVHEVDCKIMLDNGIAYCEGRYAPPGQMDVLRLPKRQLAQISLFNSNGNGKHH